MGASEIDLLDPSALADPYALYAALRRDRPVCPLKGGGYLITRHADVTAALADPAFRNAPSRFSVLHASKAERSVSSRIANNLLPFQDPPAHTGNRRRFQAAFAPCARDLSAQLPGLAESMLAERSGTLDLVADFGRPYAIAAMTRLLGFEAGESAALAAGADAFFILFAPIPDVQTFMRTEAALTEARAQVRSIVARQQKSAPESFAARALAESAEPDAAEVDLAADNAILFFADGIENVQYGIGLIWSAMLADAEAAALAHDPDRLKPLVREMLRLESPAQSIPRIADRDLVLHETPIRRDTPVHLSLASANRDPDVFPDADRAVLAPDASRNRAIPFGTGRHSCIGGTLAIEMIAAAVAALLRRGAEPATDPGGLSFLPRFGHRWPARVPARLG